MAKYNINQAVRIANGILKDSARYRNLNKSDLKKSNKILNSLNEVTESLARKWAEPSVLTNLTEDRQIIANKQSTVMELRKEISAEIRELNAFLKETKSVVS